MLKDNDDICQRAGKFTPGINMERIIPTKDEVSRKPERPSSKY